MPVIPVTTPNCLFVLGDIHFDQQDNKALGLVTKVAQNQRIAGLELLLQGDTFNSAGWSPYKAVRSKVRPGDGTIEAEVQAAKPWFDEWRNTFNVIRVRGGNHEAWFDEAKEDFPALADSSWWDQYGSLFDGCHVYGEETELKYGDLLACHGHALSGSLSTHSAATVLRNYPGQNTIYGHTHRIQGATTPTTKYGQPVAHGAWTVGTLQDREKARRDRKMRATVEKHQLGFGVVWFTHPNRFKVELCEIHVDKGQYWVIVAGEEYTYGT